MSHHPRNLKSFDSPANTVTKHGFNAWFRSNCVLLCLPLDSFQWNENEMALDGGSFFSGAALRFPAKSLTFSGLNGSYH